MLSENCSTGAFHGDKLVGMSVVKLDAKYQHFEDSLPREVKEKLPPIWMQICTVCYFYKLEKQHSVIYHYKPFLSRWEFLGKTSTVLILVALYFIFLITLFCDFSLKLQ